jgi:hypothetical protein
LVFVHAVIVGIAAAIAAKLLVGAAYYFFSTFWALFGTHKSFFCKTTKYSFTNDNKRLQMKVNNKHPTK